MKEQKIFVICDPELSRNKEVNFNLIAKARDLALHNSTEAVCVFIGPNNEDYYKELLINGAHRVIFCETSLYQRYEVFTQIVEEIFYKNSPHLMIFPNTTFGKQVAGTLATRIGAGFVADCIDIALNESYGYIFSRAAINASVIADIIVDNSHTMICTVKSNVFSSYKKEYEISNAQIEEYKNNKLNSFNLLIEPIREVESLNANETSIERAKIIFAIGRGVKKEDIESLEKLATKYGSVIGCTRVLVENGTYSRCRQIGQSGTIVSPTLYIAFGISGASQHIIGMRDAKTIIAVNKDINAPIFEYSDYIINEDTHDIIVALSKL